MLYVKYNVHLLAILVVLKHPIVQRLVTLEWVPKMARYDPFRGMWAVPGNMKTCQFYKEKVILGLPGTRKCKIFGAPCKYINIFRAYITMIETVTMFAVYGGMWGMLQTGGVVIW